jgi:hypothetical protein
MLGDNAESASIALRTNAIRFDEPAIARTVWITLVSYSELLDSSAVKVGTGTR